MCVLRIEPQPSARKKALTTEPSLQASISFIGQFSGVSIFISVPFLQKTSTALASLFLAKHTFGWNIFGLSCFKQADWSLYCPNSFSIASVPTGESEYKLELLLLPQLLKPEVFLWFLPSSSQSKSLSLANHLICVEFDISLYLPTEFTSYLIETILWQDMKIWGLLKTSDEWLLLN